MAVLIAPIDNANHAIPNDLNATTSGESNDCRTQTLRRMGASGRNVLWCGVDVQLAPPCHNRAGRSLETLRRSCMDPVRRTCRRGSFRQPWNKPGVASPLVGRDLNKALSRKMPRTPREPRQPDLFEERFPTQSSIGRHPPVPDVEGLDDREIVARIPSASVAQVQVLCDQVLARGIGDDAVPALEALWKRFFGFGISGPLREQRCALNTLAKVGTQSSRQALARIIDSPDLIDVLLPLALDCATEANLALSGQRVTCWLEDSRSAVRACAYVLARNCTPAVPKYELEKGLHDPEGSVRRACLTTMGLFGHEGAKPGLLAELEKGPTSEIVTALAGMVDDDIITRLGRCAMKHARLREQIVEELECSGEPRARKVVERLKGLK